jgi:hypothetical protein
MAADLVRQQNQILDAMNLYDNDNTELLPLGPRHTFSHNDILEMLSRVSVCCRPPSDRTHRQSSRSAAACRIVQPPPGVLNANSN